MVSTAASEHEGSRSIPVSHTVHSACMCFFQYSLIFPQSKDMQTRSSGKCISVNRCVGPVFDW